MYRITKKREKFVVLRKSDRKQMHKGLLTKTQANDLAKELLLEDARQTKSEHRFINSYEAWVSEREQYANDPKLAITTSTIGGYKSDLNLRIKPYMEDVLLSDFKYKQMSDFLKKCKAANYPYKTLQRTVRNIKTFLSAMSSEGKNPCLDMLDFKVETFVPIVPDDHEERYEKKTEVIEEATIKQILVELNKKKENDYVSALSFAIICTLFLTGIRRSELKALKRINVDLERGILTINKVYIAREGGIKKRTKNFGSFRDIDLCENGIKFFTWWLEYLKTHRPHTPYLFPAKKQNTITPVSDKLLSNIMWKTYADMGLAQIRWDKGHVVVEHSPFKGSPTKTFRHRLATLLIDNMEFDKSLSPNYVKSTLGHSRFSTTQDRYGNHNRKASRIRTVAKARALGTDKLLIN